MHRVISIRLVGFGLAALLTAAAAFSTTALFEASSPGLDLEPVGGAEAVIDMIQGQKTLLWSSLTGSVNTITAVGWPSSDGVHELGGALVIERPESGIVGIIDFGEKPMSVSFDVSG